MAETLNPFVLWGQTDDSISLKVDLRDASIDVVNLTSNRLEASFEGVGAQGNNIRYGFEIDFYQPVDSNSSKVRTMDRAVEFLIKKKDSEVWPRLTEKTEKLAWLKIDFDKFAFDDDDESEDESVANKLAAEEMMKKIEKDLADSSGLEMEMSKVYLFTYNFIQFMGYLYIVMSLSYNYFKQGPAVKEKTFELVGYQMMFCQLVAILEIIHPMTGLVKTGVVAPIMQVGGRNFILFMLILQDVRLQIAPVVWYLFMTWSTVELIRYPFYMFSSIGMDVKIVTWLRYTAWIPLYPLGILFEGTIVLMSIPLFEESGVYSLQLPNSANFALHFPWFLQGYLVMLALGGIQMMKHMHSQRRKKFGYISKSKKTK